MPVVRFIPIILLAALAGCGKDAPAPVPPPTGSIIVMDDLELLAGKWGIVKVDVVNSNSAPPADLLESQVFEVRGSRVIVKNEGDRNQELIIKLDTTKSPKEIDISSSDKDGKSQQTMKEADNKNTNSAKAIYKLEDDTLVVAISMPENPRPSEFKPVKLQKDKNDGNTVVMTFKKISDEEAARRKAIVTAASLALAKTNMGNIEKACKAYILKSGGTPPPKLEDLINPPDGGRPFIEGGLEALKDPWGQKYQYDATHTNTIGDPDPIVFTNHPVTKKKLTSRDKE
jgi:uncharacterized protein (TIGR03067 family)